MDKNNPETTKKLLDAFKDGATYVKAAEILGITRATLWNWRVADPELERQIEEAKTSRVKMVEDALYVGAMKGNTVAQIFFLKNKGGYKDTPLVEQHSHITYVWKSDRDTVQSAGVSEQDTRLGQKV
jgi:hypothetical protein